MTKDSKHYQERNILAKTLYYEAGSTCDIQEVLHIGYVIRNRVDGSKWYGKNYIEVCLKKWQFSCWNGKDLNDIEKINITNRRYKICLMVSEYIMDLPKKEIPDYMTGVCHYYEPTLVRPDWARKLKRKYPHFELKHLYLK